MEKKQIMETFFSMMGRTEIEAEDVAGKLYFDLTEKIPKVFTLWDKKVLSFENRLERESNEMRGIKVDILGTYKKLKEEVVLEWNLTTALIVMRKAVVIIRKTAGIRIICNDIATAGEVCQEIVWEDSISTTYSYLVETKRSFIERRVSLKPIEVDIKKNYNNDLPLNEIMGFMKNDDPGIVILNGEPGTGKSSLIKYMIQELSGRRFVIIQPETLMKANSDAFIEYFMNCAPNVVFILEDCEKILMKREKGTDLHTLLNLSDGILGDSLRLKFICTFNTNLTNIDEALLRKGRLKVRYEVGKLSLEKTKLHLPSATKPMTLAEIYNREENSFGTIERKRIGF